MTSQASLTPVGSGQGSHNGDEVTFHVSAEDFGYKPEKSQNRPSSGWRRIIYGFTPSWFSVNMGTGIVSTLLLEIPYEANWLYWLSVITFLLNVFLFAVFLVLTMMRYTFYPRLFRPMLQDLSQSLFIGTLPMGLSTIVSMLVQLGEPIFGPPVVTVAWSLWWIDVLMSIGCCFSAPFLIMNAHKKELRFMTAAWLLPIVTTIVSSATGAVIAGFQYDNPQHALWTITACYMLWGAGISLASSVLVIYLLRLTLHKFPPRDNMVSVFFPLGPLGQGAFAIQKFGIVARDIFPITNTLNHASTGAGNILYTLGWVIALPLWGFAMVWLFVAVVHVCSSRFPFNMGWWAFTFPLGTVAAATISLGAEMPSSVFDVLGTIFSTAVILLWMLCFTKTGHKAWVGDLFASK